MVSIIPVLTLILLLSFPIFACGRRDADTASADSAGLADTAAMSETLDTAATASAEGRTAEPADASSEAVTIADIDRWQKGMAGEAQALQAVAAKTKTAKTTLDKMTVMQDANEQSTASAGAQAAGLDEERYKFVRSKLSDATKWLAPLELGGGMDTSQLPQSQRDQMRTDRDAYFKQMSWAYPPDVIKALEPRAAELRKQELELTVARLKAMGMGQ